MGSILGFTISYNQEDPLQVQTQPAFNKALSHFDDLEILEIQIGQTNLTLWGHAGMKERIFKGENGEVLVLVGSPVGWRGWEGLPKEIG